MEIKDVDKLLSSLTEEITKTKQGIEKTDSLVRLKEIAKVYRGEDKVIAFDEIVKRIKLGDDELKIMTGWEGLDNLLRGFRPQQLVVVSALTKSGKCLAKGTEILMYNGEIKKVEDIKIGDEIMGEDSKPKTVLSLGNGKEEMFEIEQRGAKYTVNKSHILSLKKTGAKEINNISVGEYIKKSNSYKHFYKGYKTGVDFDWQPLDIDPYFLGLWLGDGTSTTSAITTADKEIVRYINIFADSMGLDIRVQNQKNNKSKVYSLSNSWDNHLLENMRELDLINNKHIPFDYLRNSRNNRLELLAGLIDSDGHLTKNKYPYIDYITKSEQLSKDIYFLASSLGFQVVVTPCKKGIKNRNFIGNYFRISISGDLSQIRTKIKRKQSLFKPQKEILSSCIKIKSLGVGEYYGFELDGNGLFVLGNFVVTHNTSFLMDMTTRLTEYHPLWFPFEESADELVRKFVERKQEPPKAFTPENMVATTVEWLESKIVEAIAKYDSKIVFIDQLDFIVPLTGDNHHLMIAKTMRELKAIAKKWNIVIFIIAHMQKTKMDNQPTMEDLRGSSSIAQEADTVILLWREAKREGGQVVITDNVNVSVQANRRFGKTGNVKMVYDNGRFLEQDWKSDEDSAQQQLKNF